MNIIIVCFGKVAKTAILQLKYDLPKVYAYHPSYIYSYMSVLDREDYVNDIAKKIRESL